MFYLDKLVLNLFTKVGAIFGLGALSGAFIVLLFFMYAVVIAKGGKK